jgi:hypothetical protein
MARPGLLLLVSGCRLPKEDAMSIHRSTDPTSREVTVVFSLPDDLHPSPVPVVGSFNHWTPGAHPLHDHGDGRRSASVVLPTGAEVHFRYLDADGNWFDDPDADQQNSDGGVVYLADTSSSEEQAHSDSAPDPAAAAAAAAVKPLAETSEAPASDAPESAEMSPLDRAAARGPLPGVERLDAIDEGR